jgi:16S rRNA U1498 N3-methylase RsmE
LYETLLSAVLFKTELGREEASIHQLRYRLGIKKLSPETVDETIRVLEELGAQRYSSLETDRSKLSENLGKTRKLALALLS